MNKLKNGVYSLLFLLVPVISFAQRAGRFGNKENGGPQPGNGPGADAPINQYEIALIIMAVSIVAFLAYKFYKSKQIAK